jgi:hypothetical protein
MIKLLAFFLGISSVLVWLTVFWQGAQPNVVTSTTAALADTATNAVGVSTTVGFKDSGILVINNEMLRYAGKGAAGTCPSPIPGASPCFTTLTRAIGSVDAQTHPANSRVYDEATGIANLSAQHNYTAFSSELEEGSNVSINPFTWKDAITSRIGNLVPTFLTGNWTPILWIFIFFQAIFLMVVALLMIGIIRGVRLF